MIIMERRRAVRKYAGPRKNGRVKLNHLHVHQVSPVFSLFSRKIAIFIYPVIHFKENIEVEKLLFVMIFSENKYQH